VTDPQDPPKPPIPAGGATQQLAALVEDVPEDEATEAADDGVEGDAAFDGAPPITTSKAPPLLPKEKKQVRNRALFIGILVFVVCTGLALGAIVVFGGLGQHPQVAQPAHPTPTAPPTQPPPAGTGTGTATDTQAAQHTHQPIRLDEFVFTSGTDAGTHH